MAITINGKVFQGNNLKIINGKIFIDNADCTPIEKEITIQVNGNIELLSVDAANSVTVTGSAGSIKTMSGDVKCGHVQGDVSTMSGDINCGRVAGSVKSMSGDIRYSK